MQNLTEQGEWGKQESTERSPTFHSLLSLKNGPSQTASVVEQGKILYDTGQFTEAVKLLQQAATAFKTSKDGLQEAMTLSNLSLAYQQLGLWAEAEEAIAQSLKLLQSGENTGTSGEQSQLIAQALDVQGQLQLAQGQAEAALTTWQKAADIYQQIGDKARLTRNQINSAQALQTLGLYLQANKILNEVQQTLTSLPDSLIVATGLRSLGNVRRVVGDLNVSRLVLGNSLAVAKRLQSPKAIAEAQLSLGNTARAQQDTEAALQYYQEAAAVSVSSITRIQAHLNLLSLLLEKKQDQNALALSSQIQSEISNLPPSRASVYTRIKFAENLTQLKEKISIDTPSWLNIAQQLSTAIEQAQSLQDRRAESYAMGSLGELYEKTGQFSDAQELTDKALFIAQSIDASDIAYQWQWQLGRILKKKGDIKGAIASYNVAYNTLQSLRGDLVAINPDVQFSFRENIEPVYRELVELLLRSPQSTASVPFEKLDQQDASLLKANTPRSPEEGINQDNLKLARNVIESLQLAELDNFFRSACLNPTQELDPVVDKKDQRAAVIYPIILPDRLDVILKLPNQELRHYKTAIAQNDVEKTIAELRKNLLDVTATGRVQQQSQQIYNWLIQPAQTELVNSGIKTLVFVLDGELRNIPMAVLYDKQQKKYLIEKYAIALTPGLQLLDPKPLRQVQLNALTAGVSEKRPVEGKEFPQLENVPRELKEIKSEVSKSEELLNQQFTQTNLQNKLQTVAFSVVHLATHGEFSSDAEKTFILTWDKLVKVKEFDNLLRVSDKDRFSGIELLVLSACQTAEGDKRAALGLAGIAMRAGVRSTLATLWSIDDRSTADVMSEFYRQLKAGVNKAQALQRAQLGVFAKEKAPYFWAPYVLVGNWL
ncbi:CHAT domain-containing protein [Nostoc sphaeroides]|uniref:Tetratricopeptide TPR_1 repeat-containing protein n=1 Tax=Nostoc sphaeroides CCNUC1 TaxID=2653204 RepID=A0A5P8W6B9_9NOSO|nr:CHAT domain-containing protein [Nostoc sphaeroides]QFS48313.1 tetratricopeptide TPR_1 repeat-containing protein [Nostoc sphaeroides CCNUC1]